MPSTSLAQNNELNYAYICGGEEIALTASTNQIFLKLSKRVNTNKLGKLLGQSALIDNISNHIVIEEKQYCVLNLVDGLDEKDCADLIAYLSKKDIVLTAFPMFMDDDQTHLSATDELIIRLKSEVSPDLLDQLLTLSHTELVRSHRFDPLTYLLQITDPTQTDAFQAAASLLATDIVNDAEPNFVVFAEKHTSDAHFSKQWSIENTGQLNGRSDADMDVTEAWKITTGCETIKVAVLDIGVDLNHPDLIPNLLEGFDVYDTTKGGYTGGDPHGTACAGIIGAAANNDIGIAGIAYDSKIIPIRVGYNQCCDENDNEYIVTSHLLVAEAIEWAWDTAEADILSCSWGGTGNSFTTSAAIERATTRGRGGKGCPILFSTGNNNQKLVSYPANLPNTIAIGASNVCDERKSLTSCDNFPEWGSNYGSELDFVAPGMDIATTDISGFEGYVTNDYLFGFGGTSSACPQVAGVLALMLTVNPELTAVESRRILSETCDKVGNYNYRNNVNYPYGTWHEEMGYGRINAERAVKAAIDQRATYQTGCCGFGHSTFGWVNTPHLGWLYFGDRWVFSDEYGWLYPANNQNPCEGIWLWPQDCERWYYITNDNPGWFYTRADGWQWKLDCGIANKIASSTTNHAFDPSNIAIPTPPQQVPNTSPSTTVEQTVPESKASIANNIQALSLKVSPNPSTQETISIHITSPAFDFMEQATLLKVYHISGQLIQSIPHIELEYNRNFELNISDYQSGLYLLHLELEDGSSIAVEKLSVL